MTIRSEIPSQLFRTLVFVSLLTCVIALTTAAAQEAENTRAVLVTGTSSGIGLRITEVLSENGFYVYAGARKAEDLARLDAMEHVQALRLDVTIQSEIDAAVDRIRTDGRELSGLINNAGVATTGPMIEMSDAEMELQFDVNLFGPYRVTKAFADLIIENQGRILTISSIAGILTGPYSGAYSMSKHGVEAYTDALAAEMDRFGVEVAALEPGNYKSQILASMVERMRAAGYSAENSRYGSMLDLMTGPLDRSQYQEPDAVAHAVLEFLTSESPKRRYMVVPNQFEASITIRQALLEVAQLNEDHAFSYSRDDLVKMLDDVLEETGSQAENAADTTTETTAPISAQATNTTTTEETPPALGIHEATYNGDVEAIKRLVAGGADVNEKEPSGGSSPLITAALFGKTEAAKALIEAGADVNQKNAEGSTALITAALFCHTEIVQALLDAGADKNIRNNAGATALDAVSAPFDAVKPIYDYLGNVLGPLGLIMDYEYLQETRPKVAEMLR